MNLTEYHQNIDKLWLNIEEQLEQQGCDVDCDTQGSVFTITFPNDEQIVINKQEPLLELWLASRAGGYHFSFQNGEWLNQNSESFWSLLETACARYGENVTFTR